MVVAITDTAHCLQCIPRRMNLMVAFSAIFEMKATIRSKIGMKATIRWITRWGRYLYRRMSHALVGMLRRGEGWGFLHRGAASAGPRGEVSGETGNRVNNIEAVNGDSV